MKLEWLACAVLAMPAASLAQKKEYVDLQRSISAVQEDVRAVERSLNENVAKLTTLLQTAVDSINKTSTNLAVADSAQRDRDKTLTGTIAGIGAKVDQMANEFQFLRTSVEDLNGRLGKMERQLVDLSNIVKVMQSPTVAPPPGGSPGASGSPPSGLSAEMLYANAMRDKDSGNYDVALQEFTEYLRNFGDTASAPNAQYYIGEIFYNQKKYDQALQAFDMVLEKFPSNDRTLDAMFMKGRTLVQLGEKSEAGNEFREVYRRAPRNSELSKKAAAQLRALNLPLTSGTRRKAK
jgi:tol-pal system protein YbgF